MARAIQYSANELYAIATARWMARTDLGYLARKVLNYDDVSSDTNGGPWRSLHQPIIDVLQKFPMPNEQQFYENDKYEHGRWRYKPIMPTPKSQRVNPDLPGGRRVLILDSRGSLKTTVNAISHTIQWILNYPDVAIGIFQANDTKAAGILGEIKRHFQANEAFRYLFPEHCPVGSRVWEWGTQNEFTTEAASPSRSPKEKTVMTASVEKGMAGLHFDVLKLSDIVDENNVQGKGLENVYSRFRMSHNLLVGPNYWMDVEGTRYHFADTYGRILDIEEATPQADREYKIHIRSVFKRDGQTEKGPFDLTTIRNAFVKDDAGNRLPWWPERFPRKALEAEEKADPWIFACQRLNHPVSTEEGDRPFPVNDRYPVIISRKNYEDNIRIAWREIITDMAWTVGTRSNYTALTVAAVSGNGNIYIEEIRHGRWLPEETLRNLLDLIKTYHRTLRVVKMEDIAFTQGFMMSFNREVQTKLHPQGIYPSVHLIKRYNQERKTERILNALQPWYKSGAMRFVIEEDPARIAAGEVKIPESTWKHLKKELEQFPASETDDILDTLADALDGKEWHGRELTRAMPNVVRDPITGQVDPAQAANIFRQIQNTATNKWLQIEDFAGFDPAQRESQRGSNEHFARTGGL